MMRGEFRGTDLDYLRMWEIEECVLDGYEPRVAGMVLEIAGELEASTLSMLFGVWSDEARWDEN